MWQHWRTSAPRHHHCCVQNGSRCAQRASHYVQRASRCVPSWVDGEKVHHGQSQTRDLNVLSHWGATWRAPTRAVMERPVLRYCLWARLSRETRSHPLPMAPTQHVLKQTWLVATTLSQGQVVRAFLVKAPAVGRYQQPSQGQMPMHGLMTHKKLQLHWVLVASP